MAQRGRSAGAVCGDMSGSKKWLSSVRQPSDGGRGSGQETSEDRMTNGLMADDTISKANLPGPPAVFIPIEAATPPQPRASLV